MALLLYICIFFLTLCFDDSVLLTVTLQGVSNKHCLLSLFHSFCYFQLSALYGIMLLQGTTTYFSSNCDKQDAEYAQEFLNSKVTNFLLSFFIPA